MKMAETQDPESGLTGSNNPSPENQEIKKSSDASKGFLFIALVISSISAFSDCDCVPNVYALQQKLIFVLLAFALSFAYEWHLQKHYPQQQSPLIFECIKILLLISIGIISWWIIIQFFSTDDHPFRCPLFAVGYLLTLALSIFIFLFTLPLFFVLVCCPCICCFGVFLGMRNFHINIREWVPIKNVHLI